MLIFPISFMGDIVLNAELKSTNKYSDIAVLRCVTTEGRAVDMASSVDLLVLKAC